MKKKIFYPYHASPHCSDGSAGTEKFNLYAVGSTASRTSLILATMRASATMIFCQMVSTNGTGLSIATNSAMISRV